MNGRIVYYSVWIESKQFTTGLPEILEQGLVTVQHCAFWLPLHRHRESAAMCTICLSISTAGRDY